MSVTDDACPINASYSYSYSITINQNPDAGISNTISVCETDPTFNMFAQLGGLPTGGGSWFDPYYNLVGNNFNPAIDSAGIYTYVLDSVGNCPGDTAYITVNVTPPPNAGTNGAITVCTADPPFDMFLQLGGTPLATGSWTDNNGNPISNLFDPAIMSSGTYTYTVLGAGSCLDESSTVTVTVNSSPAATLSVNSPICSGDSVFFNVSLIGQGPFATIISDGINNYNYSLTANGLQTNGQSISFTPTTTTTYAITSISDLTGCINLNPITATTSVVQAPNAGVGGNVSVCTNDSIINLTTYLSSQDTGGIWTDPFNNIISNYFDPNIQSGGNFTYTVSASPCPNDNAIVNVIVNTAPYLNLQDTVSTCLTTIQLNSPGGFNSYNWNNGNTSQKFNSNPIRNLCFNSSRWKWL